MSFARRLLLSSVALLVSLVAGEVAVRLAVPHTRWAQPELRTPDGRRLGSLYEIAGRVKADAEAGTRVHPGTQMLPHLEVLGCYDDPDLPYFDDDGCVLYRCNAFGFRDDEFELAKAEDELRILALGDSFTFGVGVRGEAAWPQVLERRLAGTRAGPVQVINAGFAGGHEPSQYAEWLGDDGLLFAPDAVIVGFCLNDCSPLVPMVARMPQPRAPSFSRLYDLLADRLWPPEPFDGELDFGKILRKDPEAWAATQDGLRALRDLCAVSGTRLVVAVFPMLSELGPESPYRSLHTAVRRVCSELSIESLDLTPFVPRGDDRALWAHPTDQHPNEEVQALLADGIFAYLQAHPDPARPAESDEAGAGDASRAEHDAATARSSADGPTQADDPRAPRKPRKSARPAPPASDPDAPDGPWRYVGRIPSSLRSSDAFRPGPTYTDLKSALAAARPGDTIVIGPDGASGDVVVDKPVALLGIGDTGRPVLDGSLLVTADDVLVDRLALQGRGAPRIHVRDARHVRITRCHFLDVGAGIEIVDSESCLVEDVLVSGSSTALRLFGGGHHVVRRNIFDAGAWHTVEVSHSSDNLLVENHVRQPGWTGLVVHSHSERNRIVGNVLEGGNVALAVQSDDNLVEGNTVFGANHGIYVGRTPLGRDPGAVESSWYDDPAAGADVHPRGNRVLDNVVRACQSEGVLLKAARGGVLLGNRVHDCGRRAIVLMSGCEDVEIRANTCEDSGAEPLLLLDAIAASVGENVLDGPVAIVGGAANVVTDASVTRAPGARSARAAPRRVGERLLLFGDLHVHSTLSDGASFAEENLAYARDVLGLDFLGLSDHAEVLARHPESWALVNALCAEYLEPDSFATFPGYETTYASFWQGHYNTYFPHERGEVYPAPHEVQRWIPDLSAVTPFRLLERLLADGEDFFTVRHHFQSMPDYWRQTPDDPLHLPMAEFSGVHGACFGHRELDRNRASRVDETRSFQATMEGAFANGRVLAVAGGSDSHYSFPGDHGLVAVLADSLTRDDILAAIRARRTYATTGAPIVLEVSIDGEPMGSVLDTTTPPHVRVRVEGTTDLRDVRLLLAGDEIARGTLDGVHGALDLVLDAVPADGTWLQVEVVQDDQHAALSTPVWFRPGTPVLDDDDLLADKERMTVLVLAAVLRGWPYLPQPELGGRGPAYCKDDPEAWAIVLEQWPHYLQRIDELNALGEHLGMTDPDAMQELIDRWGRTWQLPRAAVLVPNVSPLVDATPMRAAMGL